MLKAVLLPLLALIVVANCALIDLPFLRVSQNASDVAFYLFPNPNNFSDFDILEYQNLDSISNSRFSSDKKVVFLTHGFIQNVTSDFPQVLVRDYLNAGFANTTNVIAVDWGKLSGASTPVDTSIIGKLEDLPLYVKVVDNVPVVGKRVQEFITFLQNNSKISGPDQVHLVGQSLGAHISGYAGKYYKQVTNTQLDRITGTDPAGPLFQLNPSSQRIDKTDAVFVDIVHVNQGGFGYNGPLGDVDFFVNGGGPLQPGCTLQIISNTFCAHNTAPHYYGKSIGNPLLRASKSILLDIPPYVTFGEFVPRSAKGSYYINMILPANELPPP